MTQINPEALNVASQMILKEIDLRGTDAERKAKLDHFETDWKSLTGASDMYGARFVGTVYNSTGEGSCSVLFTFDYATNVLYYGCTMVSDTDKKIVSYRLNKNDGSLTITPLFSHLEPVEIFTDNSAASKQKNIDNLNAYKLNLEELGVNTANGFQMLIKIGNDQYGMLANSDNLNNFKGYSSGFGKMYTLVLQSSSGAVISSQLQSIMSNDLVTTQKEIVPAINEGFTLAQALKDLHTPIAISSENTTESKAQNVRNIADFVAKVKAAGIADVNGLAVTFLIDDSYSGVGYLSGDNSICGIETYTGLEAPSYSVVDTDGTYSYDSVLVNGSSDQITSLMLTQGARRPIILTPETTEVDEETYQKLLSDDVDVVFKDEMDNLCAFVGKEDIGSSWKFYFTVLSGNTDIPENIYLSAYEVKIVKIGVHKCTIGTNIEWMSIDEILTKGGYLKQSILTPVSLTTTPSTNKTKLDLFLSKVPNAQVMHCTYKDVYAGTLHKINGSWYGVLVGESNTLAGQLSIKLQADGTIIEGTA